MKIENKRELRNECKILNDGLIYGSSYDIEDGDIVIYRNDTVIYTEENPSVDQCKMVDASRLTRR